MRLVHQRYVHIRPSIQRLHTAVEDRRIRWIAHILNRQPKPDRRRGVPAALRSDQLKQLVPIAKRGRRRRYRIPKHIPKASQRG